VGAARVLCHSCLRRRIQVLDDERLLPAMSRRWRYQDAGSQREDDRTTALCGEAAA